MANLAGLTSDQSAKYKLDIDLNTKTGDMFSVNDTDFGTGESAGIVYLSALNFIGEIVNGETYKIQILDVQDGGAQLQLSDSMAMGETAVVPDTVIYGETYGSTVFRLATTQTLNDSIEIIAGGSIADTLSALNNKVTDGDREFDFIDADDNYVVSGDLGETTEGNLTINGVTNDEGDKSTIDFNDNSGFDLGNGTNLTINDTNLANADESAVNVGTGATAELNNVTIDNTNGTAVNVENGGSAELNDTTIQNTDGTAVNVENGGSAELNDTTIQNTDGTAVNVEDGGSAELNNVSIVDNTNLGTDSAIGAAIVNDGTMGDLSGEIANNTSTATTGDANGGAMTNNDTVGTISADFSENKAEGNSAQGGGLSNTGSGEITAITSDFTDNSAIAHSGDASGGAVANEGTVGDLTGNYSDNTASSENGNAQGGAIANEGTTGAIGGDYSGNSATATDGDASGGAIANAANAEIGNVTGDYSGNSATATDGDASGGAIANAANAEIGDIEGNFDNNTAQGGTSAVGGAIANTADSTTGNVTGSFTNNSATTTDGDAQGGAIANNGTMGEISGTFTNNSATSENGQAKGGAIYSTTDLTVTADNSTTEFTGNYTESAGQRDDNAIYLDNSDATLTLNIENNGKIVMNDNIRGADGYSVNITGDGTGTLDMFNDLHNANVTTGNVNINTINNNVKNYNVKSLTINGNTNMNVDVDLANAEMDRFTANSYGNHTGKLTITGMNLLSDATKDVTEIMFAQAGLKDVVRTTVSSVGAGSGNTYQTTMFSPIYKYNVLYDNRANAGYFVFAKGNHEIIVDPTNPTNPIVDPTKPSGGGGYHTETNSNPSSAFNPAVLATAVSNQAAAMATLNQTFEYAFEHSDGFMALPELERFAKINANSYALSTDFNENIGDIDVDHLNKAIWTRPYTAFERVPLKNGPKVDSISYGTLVGGDSNIRKIKHGWARVDSAYLGYHGSQLKYDGVDSSTNGGLLGLTETFYKGNFFTALTLSAGAGVAENSTMYGKDDNTFLMAGVASKTGYNFEFKQGKFIIQPLLHMNYTMVKTFDYTNAAGVRINSDAAHNVQIAPSVKFIGNFENGWQPYAIVGMVWDVLHEQDTTVNGVKLPNMYTKPYIQYGVGMQRCWNDRFSAYGQAMVRNGGRSGIALNFGFRWALGSKTMDELTREQQEKRAIKETKKQNQKLAKDSPKVSVNNNSEKVEKVLKQIQKDTVNNHSGATIRNDAESGAAANIEKTRPEVKVHRANNVPPVNTKKLSLKQLNTD